MTTTVRNHRAIRANDTVELDGKWFIVHGVRRVTGGTVAMIERHPDQTDEGWPWTIERWEENVEHLRLIDYERSIETTRRFYNSSDNDTLDE